jgi:glycosyltransferase involved in cell wall biosynthesis
VAKLANSTPTAGCVFFTRFQSSDVLRLALGIHDSRSDSPRCCGGGKPVKAQLFQKRGIAFRPERVSCLNCLRTLEVPDSALVASPEHRVVVAGNGVDSSFSPVGPAKEFDAPYLLYVGNRKPHKNLDRLFQAFNGINDPHLRLVLSGVEDAEIAHRLAKAGVASRVLFAGNLPDSDMPSLYRGATALVLPSLVEGFGLPLVEAMASGTPVIAAAAASIPEVVGNAAILFDPLDTGEMRQAIEFVLSSTQVRAHLRAVGLNRAKQFSWDRVARTVAEVLESARESPSRRWLRQAQFT